MGVSETEKEASAAPSGPGGEISPGLGWPLLAIVAALAASARFVHLAVAEDQGLFQGLFLDSRYYAYVAQAIRSGLGAGEHPYLLSPLYPYVLALFTDGDGVLHAAGVRILQALAGTATCVLVGDIASRVAGRRAGLAAALVAAVYGPSIYFDSRILVASLQACGLTFGLWCLVVRDARMDCRFGRLAVLGAGLALGLSAALRPTSLALLAAAVAVPWIVSVVRRSLVKKRGELALRSVLLLVGAGVAVVPFAARNVVVGGEGVLLSANGGINFWIGNHAGADGIFHAPPDYDPVNDPLHRAAASRAAGRELTHREAGAWWRARALADVRADRGRWARLLLRKLVLVAHPKEIPQLGSSFAWHERRAWTLRFPLDARYLLILALFSPAAVWLHGGARRLRALRWLFLAAATYLGTITLFFVTGRYRAPIVPVLIVLAATAVVALLESLSGAGRRSGPAVTAAAIVLVMLSTYPVFAPGGPYHFPDRFPGEERHLGMALMAEGRHGEAIDAFRRSLAHHEMSETRTNLAIALKNLGRHAEAVREYELALRADPRDGIAWYNYGNLKREHLEDHAGAERCYREAIRYRPLLGEAHFNLGLTLLELGRPAEAVEPLGRAVELAAPSDRWAEGARRALALARTHAR
jgi:Tfp pilus assembly protein PilF